MQDRYTATDTNQTGIKEFIRSIGLGQIHPKFFEFGVVRANDYLNGLNITALKI
ncbi:MAG: hypothetical protein DID91_2727704158 [Candidatus Nitrotoga sp. MKT]|nr:MAG: hypothetical protein DID91_2727704158 [Candidatus Nitrotoga sp. MKT]